MTGKSIALPKPMVAAVRATTKGAQFRNILHPIFLGLTCKMRPIQNGTVHTSIFLGKFHNKPPGCPGIVPTYIS